MIKLNFRQNSGFTLMELLMTIAIIGILASLAVTSYDEYKQRAYAAVTIQDLRNIETAIRAYHDSIESTVWLWETSIPGGSTNTKMQDLSAVTTAVGKFLPAAPIPRFKGATYYSYDNDNTDPGGYDPVSCANGYDGVGISIEGTVPNSAFYMIQQALDGDDNPNCGKVRRHVPTGLYYMFANNYRSF